MMEKQRVVPSEFVESAKKLMARSDLCSEKKVHIFVDALTEAAMALASRRRYHIANAIKNKNLRESAVIEDILSIPDKEWLLMPNFGKECLALINQLIGPLRTPTSPYPAIDILKRSATGEPQPEDAQTKIVTDRLNTAKQILRDSGMEDPHGNVLAELLRQLSEKPTPN